MSEIKLSREQLKVMGLTDEQIDAYLGVAKGSDHNSMPFPLIKINYDSDLGKVGAIGFNPKKNEDGAVVEYEAIIETPFKVRFLKSAYQYSKFDPTTNKVTIQSNIFESLGEAKNAYDLKTGVAISEIKETDNDVKLNRIILTELIDGDDKYYGIWFIKGIYLFDLNEILRKFPNEAHLNKVLELTHKKNKKGMVTYFTPELVSDEDYDILSSIKEDSEKIAEFTRWIRAQNGNETQQNSQQVNSDNQIEDEEDIVF